MAQSSTAQPVDGYTVTHTDTSVSVTLSNRYGAGDTFTFSPLDAGRIGLALVTHGLVALDEHRPG